MSILDYVLNPEKAIDQLSKISDSVGSIVKEAREAKEAIENAIEQSKDVLEELEESAEEVLKFDNKE